jgi:heparanase 1
MHMRKVWISMHCAAWLATAAAGLAQQDPHTMKAIAKVDPRFQSYNVEMVEVIGGRFWRPYTSTPVKDLPKPASGTPGIDPALFEQRKPIDLTNPRLRELAAALGPAYLRVSGSWANTVYFQDSDAPAPAQAPAGFGGVLTRAEWKGVASFAKAVDAEIVTSFSVGAGTRDANGVWTPAQAESFLKYTNSIGAPIAAAEFINEPSLPTTTGVPKGYNGAMYGRDFKVFEPVFRKDAPGALLLGPGSSGEGPGNGHSASLAMLSTDELLKGTGAADVDAFSYHIYPAISERCAAMAPASAKIGTTPEEALSSKFLARTDTVESYYAGLRDTYAPDKPLWLTETGQSACGGDRWAATFLDSFRYLYQLGSLAARNVQVVMHNTLAASDYGLIDERTLTPRPNYWAALLWHQLMGTTVLDAGASPSGGVKLFAQCTVGRSGGVTLLALNLDRVQPQSLRLAENAERYTLTGMPLQSAVVQLNGTELALSAGGDLPQLRGMEAKKGETRLAPASITFFVMGGAMNPACK